MKVRIAVICVIVLLMSAYLFCIAPNTARSEAMEPFERVYIAHRGLFDNETNAPENSLPAFRLAVEEGYGIELDVQMTTDGRLVVFHDDSLLRMCGVDKLLTECSYEELQGYTLLDTQERIPLFDDVLEVIGGQVPLVVEIKSAGDWKGTAQRTGERLDTYEGVFCIESFHPMVVEWFRKNRPKVLRGQLADDFFRSEEEMSLARKVVLSNLLLNVLSRPDFIAYNFKNADQPTYWLCRTLFPVVNVAWTPRSQQELDTAKQTFDAFIFDSFRP